MLTSARRCVYTIGMPPIATDTRTERTPIPMRWIALLLVSVLLHLVTLEWATGGIGMPSLRNQSQTAIVAQLLQPKIEPAVAPKPRIPKPAAKPKPSPRPVARPVPTTPPQPESAASEAAVIPPAGMEAPGTSVEPVIETLSAADAGAAREAPAAGPQQASDTMQYKVNLPPSAELKYDVKALRDGKPVYGHGKISWQTDGGNYTVDGEAGILFFTVLNFKSAGLIDDFGIAPVIYAEKRFRKSETNTHFNRERSTISFSASTASYPRKGGEQDRASIIWQLTGIGRGDGGKFIPGAEIDFFVAGVRDAETWRIRIIGEEEIETGTGKTSAWHMVRIPRQGSYDQQLDIWLAPQQQWYPVKLRYTETNGDYLDMSLSDLTSVAAR
ncbi:MAG: hypothetical protein JWQ21_1932 [Herminiimonas sp.]|nr:hypothetical protein [Herminiimonas sp.]